MTAAELIEQLQQLDPKLRVILAGREGDFNDIDELCTIRIAVGAGMGQFGFGVHEQVLDYKDLSGYTQEDAILIL